ncbi:MAG: archaemetzincin family Zn-dependent metalloprotease [Candidatus Omnitrophica bacterium]|nr:archaemetzincin family Zn-dependent metalloprotease [Candidatus Omnitrophota bacterium]
MFRQKRYYLLNLLIILCIFLMAFKINKKDSILILTVNLKEEPFFYLIEALGEVFSPKSLDIELKRYDLELSFSYNPERKQFHAGTLIDKLKKIYPLREGLILAILDVDLYTESLNFIFGEARLQERIALISITRLRQEFYGLAKDDKIFYQRVLKEAVHELGHLFGLSHCANPKCVMHFSNSLLDTDIKDYKFCPLCKKNLF